MQDSELTVLEQIFKMFGNVARLKMLLVMRNGAKTVMELTEASELKQSATSHQLKDMKAARLIKSQKKGLHVFYSLCDNHIMEILDSAISHICKDDCLGD